MPSFMKSPFAVFLVLALSFGALGAAPAHAASLVVNTSADTVANDGFCSLREAITAANTDAASGATAGECAAGSGADTITFAANYTITLVAPLQTVTTGSVITINGNGAANTIIQANANPGVASYRLFEVGSGGNLSLDGVTVQNGRCAGACTVPATSGGGIYNAGTLTVTNSAFSGNSAASGGAGGGIYNFGTLTVTNSTFSANSASSGLGGGVYIAGGSMLTVANSTFSGNSATYGGGVYNDSTGTLTAINSTFAGNNAGISGGGVFSYAGTMSLKNTILANNLPCGDCSVS